MKTVLFPLLLVLCPLAIPAQQPGTPLLTDSARISLLTGSAGKDLYSIFGHSAIRVTDPALQLDRCYNYGTFDLEQPNFYLLFLRGKLLYFLNPERYRDLVYSYSIEERNIQEQVLNLNDSMRQRLFELLQENLKKENRYYLYDFFYDNCSTRIRDLFETLYSDQLQYNHDGLPLGMTMRELLHSKLHPIPWTRFGMDLLLGLPADRVAAPDDFMFLPDYLHDVVGRTRLPDGQPLVAFERLTPDTPYPPPSFRPPFYAQPWFATTLFALLGFWLFCFPKTAVFLERTLAWVLGLSGLLMLFMWVGTDHITTKNNWNLLWALPTHLIFAYTPWRRYHWMAAGALALLVLLGWFFIPQQLPVEMVPVLGLILGVGWRYFFRGMRGPTAEAVG
ncbi:MAG: DUF4105 domain-containing protein [Saprospiraceae bacterium]|nr:DUF4105 domain-containing protein [Saprospiraceae bacterium]